MYIRMLNFEGTASRKAEVIGIMEETIPKIKAMGCKDCMLIMRERDTIMRSSFSGTQRNKRMQQRRLSGLN